MKDQNPFKEKLYSHTIPVREDMWKNIEANLPAKRRKFPFLWLMFGGILLMGASIIALSAMNKISAKNENVPSVESTSNIATGNISVNKTEIAQENTPNTNLNTAENLATSAENTANLHETKSSGGSITSNKKATHISTKKSNSNKTAYTKNEGLNAGTNLTETSNQIVHADASYLRNRRESNTIDKLNALSLHPFVIDAENEEITSIKPDPSCYKFRGANGKNALSFDVFAGPGIAPRTFENTEGEASPYALARNQTEKSQYAWGAGARLNLNLQQGFAVRLGLLYEQIGDKFDYTDPNATQETKTINSFYSADGTFLYSDTTVVLIFGKRIKQIHNRYTHIDIPLLLSYELPFGRSTLMLNAGPVLNLTSSQHGQILDSSLNPVHITQGTPDELKAYKNSLGLSVYLGAGALFPLTDNISALVEPRILYRIKPVTLDTYQLKEHRSFAGLNLGIRYHFN